MPQQWAFDQPESRRFTEARQAFLRPVLSVLKQQVGLDTALDVGCGVGYFSGFLRDMGLRVVALDGRQGNVEEAGRRFPEIEFHVADLEEPGVQSHGPADLVLCVGLLYHLENPFRAIRNLYGLVSKVVLIESMCVPGAHAILDLQDEGRGEDQGLNFVAFYPTEACLVKMLYRAGFNSVYRFQDLPAHPDFHETASRRRLRTMLAASKVPLNCPPLALVREPQSSDPWTKRGARLWRRAARVLRSIAELPPKGQLGGQT